MGPTNQRFAAREQSGFSFNDWLVVHLKLFGLNAFNNLMMQINVALCALTQLLIEEVDAHCPLSFGCVHRKFSMLQ
ncbi:MAG: hypothetical protein B7X54_00450 [Idiomarina sp. 34-48-12]|nr:MAG: hypothetical protein B7X54_00450 [Idiomarina sp. 34-48-12]